MRYLLRLSLALALVVGTLAAASLFLPGRYQVRRTITIAAPPERVLPRVTDLARWREWHVWLTRDAGIRLEGPAATGEAGAWLAWRSARQGGGRIERVRVVPDELIEYRFTIEGMSVMSTATIRGVAAAGGRHTVVTWTAEGRLGRSPLTRWFGLALGPLLGPDMERSLDALKARCEADGPA